MTAASRGATRTRALAPAPGFSLAEVVVALVVLTIGALGAAAHAAHAARIATHAVRYEWAVLQVATLLDSLIVTEAAADGAKRDRHAAYSWRVAADSTGRRVVVEARLHASADTIRLSARRPPIPPLLRSAP